MVLQLWGPRVGLLHGGNLLNVTRFSKLKGGGMLDVIIMIINAVIPKLMISEKFQLTFDRVWYIDERSASSSPIDVEFLLEFFELKSQRFPRKTQFRASF